MEHGRGSRAPATFRCCRGESLPSPLFARYPLMPVASKSEGFPILELKPTSKCVCGCPCVVADYNVHFVSLQVCLGITCPTGGRL